MMVAPLFRSEDSYFYTGTGLSDYPSIVYTLNPYPFSISSSGTTALTADVGAVPEPATMFLLGTGLAGAALARRKKRSE